jgi:hypothetical protein
MTKNESNKTRLEGVPFPRSPMVAKQDPPGAQWTTSVACASYI